MSGEAATATGAATGAAGAATAVRVPPRSIRSDLRAVRIVWLRELIRFARDRLRVVTSLLQPVLYLFVLGTGLGSVTSIGASVSLRTFMFPGVLALAVLFTAMFSAASIVWDREFGFLREMLVAPVGRWALVLGKCLGGASVAALQGAALIAFAGLAGVPYDPVLVLELVALLLLLAFTVTAFGVMAAARIRSIQSFMALTQMFVMPMFFLSGALFPLGGLPGWLAVLTRLNPLTYAVAPMRQAVFSHLPGADAALAPGVSWFGWSVPLGMEVGVIAVLAVVTLGIAVLEFRGAD